MYLTNIDSTNIHIIKHNLDVRHKKIVKEVTIENNHKSSVISVSDYSTQVQESFDFLSAVEMGVEMIKKYSLYANDYSVRKSRQLLMNGRPIFIMNRNISIQVLSNVGKKPIAI